jgi:hypothetical protein
VNSPPMPSLVSLIEISSIGDAAIGGHTTAGAEAEHAERPSRLQGKTCGRRPFQSYLLSHDKELDGWTPDDVSNQSAKRHRTNELFKELQVNTFIFHQVSHAYTSWQTFLFTCS